MKFSDEVAIHIYNNFPPEDIDKFVQSAMSDLSLYEAEVGTMPGDRLSRGVHPSDAAIAYAMCIRYKDSPITDTLVWSAGGSTGWEPVSYFLTDTPPDPKKTVYMNGQYVDIAQIPSDAGFSTLVEVSLDEIDQAINHPAPSIPKSLLKEYKVKDRPGRAPVWAKELMVAMGYVGRRDIAAALKAIASNPRTAIQIYHLANVLAAEVLRSAQPDAKVSSVLRQIDEFLNQADEAPSREAIIQLSEMFK